MTPVDQVRTGYGCGQCTEASIASLLGVSLDVVPDLWAGPHVPVDAPLEEHQPKERCEALWRWLREVHGVVWCELRFSSLLSGTRIGADFVTQALRMVFPHLRNPEIASWAEHHVMFGPNPSGVEHCVVGRGGAFVHDPNPSRRGIAACSGLIFLVPLEQCPPELPLAARWDLEVSDG